MCKQRKWRQVHSLPSACGRARVCRNSLDGQDGCDEMDSGSEGGVGCVVSGGDTTELFDFLEEVLDQVAPFVDFGVIGDACGAAGIGRDDRQSTALVQLEAQPVAVKGLVADQRAQRNAIQQRLDANAVVALAWQKDEAGEIAKRIDERHDLGGQAAARLADGLILSPPFAPVPCRWTLTIVPSMRAYSKSGSCEKALKIRSNTPFTAHRRKRFHTEPHLPNCSGRSRHGAPARTTHSTPSRNCRLSRPDRPGSPSLPGRSGAMRAHCPSLKTVPSKPGPPLPALNQTSVTRGRLVSRYKLIDLDSHRERYWR